MINGKQCTIFWYVDENTFPHVDENVVSDTIKSIEKNVGTFVTT